MKRLMKIANNNEYKLISEPHLTYEDDTCECECEDGYFDERMPILNKELNKEMNEIGSKGLAEYLDCEYDGIEKDIIESIIPQFDGTNIITTVKATRELTDEELNKIKNYIIVQYSDGWGECFEQYPYYACRERVYEDGLLNNFHYGEVRYYCHLWSPSTSYYWE